MSRVRSLGRRGVVVAATLVLGAAAVVGARVRRAPGVTAAREPVTPNLSARAAVTGPPRAPDAQSSRPRPGAAPPPRSEPVDLEDYLRNGPKEPLVPPVVNVDAELAPGSTWSDEPLTPPVIHVEVELAPGSAPPSQEPLVPPEITSDGVRGR